MIPRVCGHYCRGKSIVPVQVDNTILRIESVFPTQRLPEFRKFQDAKNSFLFLESCNCSDCKMTVIVLVREKQGNE